MLWIANTTRQSMDINVRLPEMGRVYVHQLSSGRQDVVKDLSPSQESAFIEHIQRFGGKSRKDLHGKMKGFSGLAYATDKPFSEDEFHYGDDVVIDEAENRSVTEAVKAAVSADQKMINRDGSRMSTGGVVEVVAEKEAANKRKVKMRVDLDPTSTVSDKLPV